MTKKVTKSVPAPVPTMTANGHASLNPELKQAMRDAKAAGKSTASIAREFNVDASTAWVVLNGPSKGTGRVAGKHSPAYVASMSAAKAARDTAIAAANAVYAEAEKAAASLDSAWLAEQKATSDKIAAEKEKVAQAKQEYRNRLATLKAEYAALKAF